MEELKRIEEGSTLMIGASGKRYHTVKLLSAKKYQEFEVCQRELATGLSVKTLYTELNAIYQINSQVKIKQNKKGETIFESNNVETNQRLHNILSGIHKINQRRSTVIKIAMLYIVEEGTHPGTYNEDQEEQKRQDLETEYPYEDFFRLATGGLQQLIADLNELSHLGLLIPVMDAE